MEDDYLLSRINNNCSVCSLLVDAGRSIPCTPADFSRCSIAVMNAGHQKSLSKHFFVLLSLSTAPEAACQQTYGEKEENGEEEVHSRLFCFPSFFFFKFWLQRQIEDLEVLFTISDYSLLPIKGPPHGCNKSEQSPEEKVSLTEPLETATLLSSFFLPF